MKIYYKLMSWINLLFIVKQILMLNDEFFCY